MNPPNQIESTLFHFHIYHTSSNTTINSTILLPLSPLLLTLKLLGIEITITRTTLIIII